MHPHLPTLLLLLLTTLTPLLATPLQSSSSSSSSDNSNNNNEITAADAKAFTKAACHDIEALRKDVLAQAAGGELSETEQQSETMDRLLEQSLGCEEVFGDDSDDGMGDAVMFEGGSD